MFAVVWCYCAICFFLSQIKNASKCIWQSSCVERKVLAVAICLLDSQNTGSQEIGQCWFSTVSQPALHPVRGSHRTGWRACMCASVLIGQVMLSLSQLGFWAQCHSIPLCPGIASQQLPHSGGRSGAFFYTPTADKAWVNAYCSARCFFIIHIHCKSWLDLHTDVMQAFLIAVVCSSISFLNFT